MDHHSLSLSLFTFHFTSQPVTTLLHGQGEEVGSDAQLKEAWAQNVQDQALLEALAQNVQDQGLLEALAQNVQNWELFKKSQKK